MTDVQQRRDLTPAEVASFLRRNPDFLNDYPDLAMALTLPRALGPSTSLASYQMEVLRDKNRALNRRLHELVAIANENEQLVVRVHALTLSLMRARSAAEALSRIVAMLNEDLHSDLVRVVLTRPLSEPFEAEWFSRVDSGAAELAPVRELLVRSEPVCGRLEQHSSAYLFGERSGDVRSAVVLPVAGWGLLAIGSTDANRFHPGMGTLFLKLIIDAVSTALTRYGSAD